MSEITDIFLERGHITKEAADRLDQFEEIIKSANFWNTIKEPAKDLLLGLGSSYLMYKGLKHLDKRTQKQDLEEQSRATALQAQKTLDHLRQHDNIFKNNPEMATERFKEVYALAPSLLGNPTLSSKIVKKYLTKGIDLDAAQKLTELQSTIAEHRSLTKPEMDERGKELGEDLGEHFKTFGGSISTAFPKKASYEGLSLTKQAEYLADAYSLAKVANWKEHLKSAVATMGLMGAAGLGIAGGNKLISMYNEKKLKDKLNTSWSMTLNKLKAMTSSGGRYADGVDYHSPDTQNQAREAFDTLSSLSPTLATNPQTATTFVNRAIQNDSQIDPELLKTITDIQRNIAQSGSKEGPLDVVMQTGQNVMRSIPRPAPPPKEPPVTGVGTLYG